MIIPKDKYYTLEEYYQLEYQFEELRIEYLNGNIRSMARGTIQHAMISGNIFVALSNKLKNTQCQPFNSDAHLAIDELKCILHPDVFVVCNGIEISDFDKHGIKNASVVIEVLSEGTELYDRTEKFQKYKKLTSFKEYILIHQKQICIETFVRHSEKLWEINSSRDIEESLYIATLDLNIPINDIYTGLAFDSD